MATLVDSFSSTWEQRYGGVTLPLSRSWVYPRTETVAIRQRTAGSTPSYFTKLKEGRLLPQNSLSFDDREMSRHHAKFVYDTPTNKAVWIEPHWAGVDLISASVGVDDPEWISHKNRAIFQCLSNAKNQEVMLPVTLLEAGKTASMVHSRAVQIVESVRALRKGNLRRFMNHMGLSPSNTREKSFNRDFGKHPKETAANAWLEYQYGWTPFMAEVRGAFNLLADAVDQNSDSRPGVARGRSRFPRVTKVNYPNSNIGCPYSTVYADWVVTDTMENYVRCTWRFRVKGSDLPTRLGLTNPAEVVWELVPYSFVADWFLPIGDYLSQFDIPYNFDSVDYSIGAKLVANRSVSLTKVRTAGWTGSLSGGTNRRVAASRYVYGGFPSVSFDSLFNLNAFRMSIRRSVSSIALLSQLFRGR